MGTKIRKIYLNTMQLKAFLRKVGVRPAYFIATIAFSVGAALFEAVAVSILIPMANGIIKMDFHFVRVMPFFKTIIATFPALFDAPRSPVFVMLVFTVFIASITKNVFQYLASVTAAYQIKRFGNELRKLLFDRYLIFGKLFFDRNNAGYLQSIILDFITFITAQLAGLGSMLSYLLMLMVYLMMMFFISWKVSIFIITILPILNYSLKWLMVKIKKTSKSYITAYSALGKNIFNVLSCMPLVKLYTNEEKEKKVFASKSDEVQTLEFSIEKKQLLVGPLQDVIVQVATLFLLSFMAFMVGKTKTIEIGSFLVFFYLLKKSQTTFNSLNQMRSAFASISGPLAVVRHMLEDKDKYIITGGAKTFTGLTGALEMLHLNFSYTSDTPVLKDVTFSIEKGKMIALVGPTGSGKTTCINLLLRFYDCPPRSILIDGIDIREFTPASLMASVAVVSQDTWLFNDTFRNNIVYGLRRAVSQEELVGITKKARLYDFITSLPDGFDTYIGDRGVQLSGGERQRVSIARALLKNSDILILDEATSSLDSKTERLIQESISETLQGKTVIAIAHRLSTIKHADKILVLEKGRIVEEGSLEDLLARKGKFYEYWQEQKFY
ncbi:MAG: ABC transporter ATP-binding protein [Candidatus Omnitrophota bacterium]